VGVERVGVTAGASTPEFLVEVVVEFLRSRAAPVLRELNVVEEDVRFGLPHELIEMARQAGTPLAPASPTALP
jgi:4-hydroxy-3-methylbut-2-enyl diphosphate reductase